MKRPNRNIEIFSMSVLDLFASALGGFILITIILFPNYGKKDLIAREITETKTKQAQLQDQIDRSEAKLRAAELDQQRSELTLTECKSAAAALEKTAAVKLVQLREVEAERRQLESCEVALADTFLVVAISWTFPQDIDLHVVDPEGREFYWSKNNRDRRDFPDSDAQLSYDAVAGPGIELWQDPRAHPGTYQIRYHSVNSLAAIEVTGNVFYRRGRIALPPVTLNAGAGLPVLHVADVVIGQNGSVDVHPGGGSP